MQYWMISIMNHYGYLGIALLILIENLFPPIPSEVILTFGGFLTTYTNMNLIGVILFSTLGSVLGAVVLYQIGSLVPVSKLEAIVSGKIGKLLHFKKEDVSHAVEWFDSKGNYTVFFCRFIPIVRSLISIPAGMAPCIFPNFLFSPPSEVSSGIPYSSHLEHLPVLPGKRRHNISTLIIRQENLYFVLSLSLEFSYT